MANAKPGELFRNNYALPQESTADSGRFRSRLFAAYRAQVAWDKDWQFAAALRRATGDVIPQNGTVYLVDSWMQAAKLVDLLSFITVVGDTLIAVGYNQRATWIAAVRTIFLQENLLYEIDDFGGVHPKIDAEFERVVESAVRALNDPRFAAAKLPFDAAFRDLATMPPDYKSAVRNLFECAECLFKLALNGKQLTADNVKQELARVVDRRYAQADPATRQTAAKFVLTLERWVESAHPYRHGHGSEIPVAPPEELVIAQFSIGAAIVRWLTTIVP